LLGANLEHDGKLPCCTVDIGSDFGNGHSRERHPTGSSGRGSVARAHVDVDQVTVGKVGWSVDRFNGHSDQARVVSPRTDRADWHELIGSHWPDETATE